MTDKELIQTLRSCQKAGSCLSCEAFTQCRGLEELQGQAANRLESLLAENERLKTQLPKWRPASEPPEEYRDEYGELKCFLVCVENVGKPFRAVFDGKHWGDGWNVVAVTHWMPLPSTEGVE